MTRRLRIAIAIMAGLAIVAAGCGDNSSGSTTTTTSGGSTTSAPGGPTTTSGSKPDIVIGAQDFGESAILAEIYKQAFVHAGMNASVKSLGTGAFRDVEVAAFASKDINFAPEYAASMLEFLNNKKGEATGDATATVGKLQPYLQAKGLVALDPTEAVDTNAFVMTKEKSDSLGITTLSDLAAKGTSLKIGAPVDCLTNPFCVPGLKSVYGADFSNNFTQLEAGAIAPALSAGQIDVALLFSTDSRIVTNGWVLLQDDKHMLAADNVVPVMTQEVKDAYGDTLTQVADAIKAKLTTADLTALNKSYDVDKEDADKIATDWLTQNGLL